MNTRTIRSQAAVIVGLLLACAGLGLLIGFDEIDIAFVGLIIFTLGALLVCRVDGNYGDQS